MFHPKLRRVFALTALISALSLLPAQAAGLSPRVHGQRAASGLSARIERLGSLALSFLTGLLEKSGVMISPDGNH